MAKDRLRWYCDVVHHRIQYTLIGGLWGATLAYHVNNSGLVLVLGFVLLIFASLGVVAEYWLYRMERKEAQERRKRWLSDESGEGS